MSRGRLFLVPVLVLLCTGMAFHLAADPKVQRLRRLLRPGQLAVSGDWSPPGLRHGSTFAVENRVPSPNLALIFETSDAYRLRFYYVLEGGNPAEVRVAGKSAGRLKAGKGWQRASVITPFVEAGSPLKVSFQIPVAGRLILRRIDYRNYAFRIGSLLLAKPDGGARGSRSAAETGSVLAGLIVLWAAATLLLKRWGRRGASTGTALLPIGILSLAVPVFQLASPYAVHARPAFLAVVIFGTAVLSTARLLIPRVGRQEALARLGLLAGGVLVAAILSEVALRISNPPISRPRVGSYLRYSPEYGWANRPGAHGWHLNIRYHVRINRFGHRGPDYSMEKRPGVFRILGLGDSTTFGWGVEEEQTYLRHLESRLRAAGHKVEVLNAGVPAWHSVQSLHYLLKEGVRFQPDLVVASFFIDDVLYYPLDRFRKGSIASGLRRNEAWVARQKRGGLQHSFRLYNVTFNLTRIVKAIRTHKQLNPYPTFEAERKAFSSRRNFDKDQSKVEGLKKLLADWEKARDRLGIPFLFLHTPLGGALLAPDFQGESRALRRLSRSRGFLYLDVVPLLERHPAPRTLYLHPRDMHMSAAGHAIIGEALAKMVLEREWLGKSAPPPP